MKQIDAVLINRAAERGGLVSIDDVRAVGLTTRQWRARTDVEWLKVTPHRWGHIATTPTWETIADAALDWLGKDAALFGVSAAANWTMAPFELELPVHVVVPRGRRWLSRSVVVHSTKQWTTGDLLVQNGRRTTSATRTIIDLAGQPVSARDLADAIDSAMNHRWTAVPTLQKRMLKLGGPGRAGIRRLRTVVLDAGGHSFLERRFLKLVREAGLPGPMCQVIERDGDTTIARVDFLFPASNVIVEVSGRLGHASDEERAKDAKRRNALQLRGRVVLEFTTGAVLDDPAGTTATVVQALGLASVTAS